MIIQRAFWAALFAQLAFLFGATSAWGQNKMAVPEHLAPVERVQPMTQMMPSVGMPPQLAMPIGFDPAGYPYGVEQVGYSAAGGQACGCDQCLSGNGNGDGAGPGGWLPGLFGGGGHGHGGGHHGGHGTGGGHGGYLGLLAPYAGGGCCQPHWFDVHAEAVFLRQYNDSRFVEFARESTTTVLSSNDLTLKDYDPGLRITGMWQTGPGSNLELTYLGMFNLSRFSFADSNAGNLFSAFNNFDPFTVQLEQFDFANRYNLKLDHQLNSLELNYRRRFVGPTCLVQGSWLCGFRYVNMAEHFTFESIKNSRADVGNYDQRTRNHLYGLQIGGDGWLCIVPGFSIGIDGKGGIFGNNSSVDQRITKIDVATNQPGAFDPGEVVATDIAFVGEIGLLATYRVNPYLTIRGGYQMIFASGVALSMDNFNPTLATDATASPPYTPFLDHDGYAFYDGFNIGAEFMW